MRNGLPIAAITVFISLTVSSTLYADDTIAALNKSTLPSMVTLQATTDSGIVTETGFLAVKDGIIVTALHPLMGAVSVQATMPNGDVDDCTGVVDMDQKSDIALVRVKEYGVPLLALKAGTPAAGAHLYISEKNDQSFEASACTVDKITNTHGIDSIEFSSSESENNLLKTASGSPLMNADGTVLGVVDYSTTEKHAYAIPIAKILALDATLPTTPWDQVQYAAPIDTTVDDAVAIAVKAYSDSIAAFAVADISFLNNKPSDVTDNDFYKAGSDVEDALATLKALPTKKTDQTDLVPELSRRLRRAKNMLTDIERASERLSTKLGWDGETTKNKYREAYADFDELRSDIPDSLKDWLASEYATAKFTPDQVHTIECTLDPTGYVIGGVAFVDTPNQIEAADRRNICGRIGLHNDDTIVQVDGKPIGCLKDLNDAIIAAAGNSIDITVQRDGKPREIKAKISRKLPTSPFDYERE